MPTDLPDPRPTLLVMDFQAGLLADKKVGFDASLALAGHRMAVSAEIAARIGRRWRIVFAEFEGFGPVDEGLFALAARSGETPAVLGKDRSDLFDPGNFDRRRVEACLAPMRSSRAPLVIVGANATECVLRSAVSARGSGMEAVVAARATLNHLAPECRTREGYGALNGIGRVREAYRLATGDILDTTGLEGETDLASAHERRAREADKETRRWKTPGKH